ncbi:MAG TPA: hypothetical protein VLS25_08850 [Dehalococcoidia bacterium]|nr:hypothetical protein [Dehalococcoidia bacterium]
MAERAVQCEWTQETWRGSPAEFAELLSETAELVAGEDGDTDPHISIGKSGDDLSFDSVSEFSEFARSEDRRLREARRVYAAIGRFRAVRVTLVFIDSRLMGMKAIQATVRGSDAVAANGVSAEVRRLARQNGRRLSLWISTYAAWAVGLALTIPDYLSDSGFTGTLSWAGIGLMIAAVGFGLLHPLLVPHFELIDPDAPETAAARVRGALTGGGRWFLAAVAGAAIYALVQKLIAG